MMYIHSKLDIRYYRQRQHDAVRMEYIRKKIVHWLRKRFRVTTSLWPILHYLNRHPIRLRRYLYHLMPEEQNVSLSFLFDDIFCDFYLPSFLDSALKSNNAEVKALCDNILVIMHDDALYEAAKAIPCLTWIGSFIIPLVGEERWMARVKGMRVKGLNNNIEAFMAERIHYILPFDAYDNFTELVLDVPQFQERVRHAIHKARFKEGLIHYIRNSNMLMDWRWYFEMKKKKKRTRQLVALDYVYQKTIHREWAESIYHGEFLSYDDFVQFIGTGRITWQNALDIEHETLFF